MMSENIVDYLRITLYAALVLVVFFLVQAWESEHTKPLPVPSAIANELPFNRYVPNSAAPLQPVTSSSISQTSSATAAARFIHITTDLLQVNIDPRGGNIVEVKLLQYPETLNSSIPF